MSSYIPLEKLEVYILSRAYSREIWKIYESMNWSLRKVLGDQLIESTDSVGANIAEGYGRYHYLDKNKFYYNARGSLLESRHWISLCFERKIIEEMTFYQLQKIVERISPKLNQLIQSQYRQKGIL